MIDYNAMLVNLRERGARANCPMCDGTTWMPFGDLGNMLGFVLGMTTDNDLIGAEGQRAGVGVYVLTCEACGFLRLHSTQVLD